MPVCAEQAALGLIRAAALKREQWNSALTIVSRGRPAGHTVKIQGRAPDCPSNTVLFEYHILIAIIFRAVARRRTAALRGVLCLENSAPLHRIRGGRRCLRHQQSEQSTRTQFQRNTKAQSSVPGWF